MNVWLVGRLMMMVMVFMVMMRASNGMKTTLLGR